MEPLNESTIISIYIVHMIVAVGLLIYWNFKIERDGYKISIKKKPHRYQGN